MIPEQRINGVDIHLEGFTMEEIKDIIGYISSVEANRKSRLVLVNLDTPEDGTDEALKRLLELWPEDRVPPFTLFVNKEKDNLEHEK